jgi:hypothetical protein
VDKVTKFIEQMLQTSSSEALCEPCLAFALEAPLAVIQDATKRMATGEAYVRAVATCGNCGRTTDTIASFAAAPDHGGTGDGDRVPKCVRCSRRLENEDEESWHGERFHRQCLVVLRSQAQIANTRQMTRLSRQLIDHGRARVAEALSAEHLARMDWFLRLVRPDGLCLSCLGRIFIEIREVARIIEAALLRRKIVDVRRGLCAMCRHERTIVRHSPTV